MSAKYTTHSTFLSTIILCLALPSVCYTQPFSVLNYVPDELVVRFALKPNGEQRTRIERNMLLNSVVGGHVKFEYNLVPGLAVVKLPEHVKVEEAIPALKNTGSILYAYPNYRAYALLAKPNDTRFSELWGMHNTGQPHPVEGGGISSGTPDADIDAPEAWDIETNASEIIVAVIDTGVNYTHPDLRANMWVNEAELNGVPGVDDDGHGYVDDIYGYNFCNNNGDPNDDNCHGTNCAGIIGAVGNNGEGVTGVCWNVKIMALKWMDSIGSGDIADAIGCINYAVTLGAKVLNNSWIWPEDYLPLRETIEAAHANGVLFVAAAGNNGTNNDFAPVYPASYDCDNIISVMSTDDNDVRSVHLDRPPPWTWASNYGGDSVDLGAPGSDILSTFPTYETEEMDLYGLSTYYETTGGTSMAAPHVAGACALIWSVNPSLTHIQVKQIILNTVDKLRALDGLCVTGGRLNLYEAVLEAAKNEQILRKVDNIAAGNSVLRYDEITYTIYYTNPVTNPELTGVTIIDYLPNEVEPNNPFDPNYNLSARTYTWNIGTLPPGSSWGSVTIKVNVNELAEPLGTIRNLCILRANEIRPVYATEITDVSAYNPGVIYVDRKAPGSNTGMTWDNAYRDLQDALERAAAGCGSQIWVAAETYCPSKKIWPDSPSSATFQLVNGVPIYGGFPSGGDQRNWMTNETILEGQNAISNVVTADSIEDATLDGFTIKNGGVGIYCTYSNLNIVNCKLKENSGYGIYIANDSHPYIHNCLFTDNSVYGIYCENGSGPVITNCTFNGNNTTQSAIYAWESSDVKLADCIIKNHTGYGIDVSSSTLDLTNSVIRFNGGFGICLRNALYPTTIKNNWIHNNLRDNNGEYGYGIYIYNALTPVIIRNNTIVSNVSYGVYCESSTAPDISNCIIWGNNNAGDQLNGCTATYSRFTNPGFMNPGDPNDLHIGANSLCKNAGNPDGDYQGETDIDGEGRVKYGRVDIGGDEYYWSPADFNRDEFVNFIDYAIFAQAWMSRPVDSKWNPDCDLAADDIIDYYDLDLFCEGWLTQAGWARSFTCGAGEGMGQSMASGFTPAVSSISAESPFDSGLRAESQTEKVEPVKIEQMIKWLEEIWLDPETRKFIDEDTWLKFIQSLKEEL